MNGVILVVILQPNQFVPTDLKWDELSEYLMSNSAQSFDEINLLYNDNGEYFVRHELFPKHYRDKIPLDLGLKRLRGEA